MANVKGIEVNGEVFDIEDESARTNAEANATAIGDLSELETTEKTELVSAVNEVATKESVVTIGTIYQQPGVYSYVKVAFSALIAKMAVNQSLSFLFSGGRGRAAIVSVEKTGSGSSIGVVFPDSEFYSSITYYSIENDNTVYLPYTNTGTYAKLLCLSSLPGGASKDDVTISLASSRVGTMYEIPAFPTDLTSFAEYHSQNSGTTATISIMASSVYMIVIQQGYPSVGMVLFCSNFSTAAEFKVFNPITQAWVSNGNSFNLSNIQITVGALQLTLNFNSSGSYRVYKIG